jgi:hypothetical protein
MDDAAVERVARNEAVFRQANERLRRRVPEAHALEEPIPFLCECGDERCTTAVPVALDVYERVRADATRFLVAAGHREPSYERLVEATPDYEIVEKIGRAAEIAVGYVPRAL